MDSKTKLKKTLQSNTAALRQKFFYERTQFDTQCHPGPRSGIQSFLQTVFLQTNPIYA